MYRTVWGISNLPTLVRYESVGGEVKETGRLVEGELVSVGQLEEFLR